MKLSYLFFLFIFFSSCSKKNPPGTSSIVGDWVWIKSSGGLANAVITPQSTNRTWGLTFKTDFTFVQSGDFNAPGAGSYVLTEETHPQETIQWINTSFPAESIKYRYSFISNDTLRLDHNIEVDGLSNFFVRK